MMNGIEKITAHIEAEAKQDVDAVRAEAEAKCQEIKAAYDKKAQDAYWKQVHSGTQECEMQLQRRKKAAEMEAKKSQLAFKQEIISQAFSRAERKLANLPEEQYVPFLAYQAARAATTGQEELIFNERDKAGCAAKVLAEANALVEKNGLPGTLKISPETRPIMGGIIVRSGAVEANCSVEALLEQSRDTLAYQVAETLFPGLR